MAKKRRARKKKFTVHFELGTGGLAGLAIISFCVFLWMFLLGVWAGQTVLLPSDKGDTAKAINRFSAKIWTQGQGSAKQQKKSLGTKATARKSKAGQKDDEEEASFFTLQVAAYEIENNARQEVLDWQARGEDAFFLRPKEGSSIFRVFLGRYDTLAAANEKVDQLEEGENLQAFITLLPVTENQ